MKVLIFLLLLAVGAMAASPASPTPEDEVFIQAGKAIINYASQARCDPADPMAWARNMSVIQTAVIDLVNIVQFVIDEQAAECYRAYVTADKLSPETEKIVQAFNQVIAKMNTANNQGKEEIPKFEMPAAPQVKEEAKPEIVDNNLHPASAVKTAINDLPNEKKNEILEKAKLAEEKITEAKETVDVVNEASDLPA